MLQRGTAAGKGDVRLPGLVILRYPGVPKTLAEFLYKGCHGRTGLKGKDPGIAKPVITEAACIGGRKGKSLQELQDGVFLILCAVASECERHMQVFPGNKPSLQTGLHKLVLAARQMPDPVRVRMYGDEKSHSHSSSHTVTV